jgi:hypothetical protein
MGTRLDWLHGIFPALVTPFDPKTEEIDEEAYRRLIRHVLPYVDGVVTSGTTGEFPYLTAPSSGDWWRSRARKWGEEGDRRMRRLRHRTGPRPGPGRKRGRADAILVVTPYFLHPVR